MVTYVLDASAVLRYLDDEAGSDRVAEIIRVAPVPGPARRSCRLFTGARSRE